MSAARVVVVGGGVAGLTTAYRLLHPGVPPARSARALRVVLLEAETHAGGKIRTEHIDGCVVDAGPDSFLTTRPWALALADELGLRAELIGIRPGSRAYIHRHGRMHPLPAGLSGLVPARADAWLNAGMLSWPGRLRAALDLVLPADSPPHDKAWPHSRAGASAQKPGNG